MADTDMRQETLIAETKTEKVVEVQPTGSFLEHLDDTEREFIAKGIHNFSYRKEECYDEQATQDLRRELKAALRAIGSEGLIPEHIIDAKIDTAVLPLGQKKGYWLKRLISKTGGETQRLLRGLEKVNMFLRNYGNAKRKPPIPPKNVKVPIEKFQELEDKASALDIKSVTVSESAPVFQTAPETMDTKDDVVAKKIDKKSNEEPEAKRAYDADSDTDSEKDSTRHRRIKHKSKNKRSKRVKFYEPSDSESSEESDLSEDDFQYYYKRLKKPHRVYSYRKHSRHRPFSTVPQERYSRIPDQLFNPNVPIKPFTQEPLPPAPVEVPKPSPQVYNFMPNTQKPKNEYINHFLGNGRY